MRFGDVAGCYSEGINASWTDCAISTPYSSQRVWIVIILVLNRVSLQGQSRFYVVIGALDAMLPVVVPC